MNLRALPFPVVVLSMALVACSGSGSSDEPATPPPPDASAAPDPDPPDDPPPEDPPTGDASTTLTVEDVTADEGNGAVTFVVRANGSNLDDVRVDYATSDGSASADSDYVASAGTLTFSSDATEQTVVVDVLEDSEPEDEETFNLELSNPLNAEIADAAGVATITNDDYNIVVVFTDDQRFDTLEHMPNVSERLMPQGVNFDNAYVPTPLCCPARASTYSGGFLAQNTGVLTNGPPNGGVQAFDDSVNIGTRLQEVGYQTLFIGKWMNDYVDHAPYVPPGWSTFVGRAEWVTQADWSSFRYAVGSSDQSSSTGTEVNSAGQYHVYFEQDQIVEFIEGVPSEEPFFVFWSTTAPHPPSVPDEPDRGAFADFTYRERGYGESDLTDKPGWVQAPGSESPSGDDEEVRDQLRSMLSVDRALGSIMDVIDAQGELEQTVFVVMSDNGYMWGEHGLWGKNKPYEESLRVPLLVVMPGVDPRSDDHLVYAVLDLAPTLYDIVGISAESDGMSLLPLLNDPGIDWRNELFFEKYSPTTTVNGLWAGVRQDNWKYIQYYNGEEELYDLDADPFELENRAADPQQAEVRAGLADRMEELIGLSIKPLRNVNTDGQVGQAYTLALEAWGGEPPLEWSVQSGDLPPGLSFDPATGEISGTPSTAGSWTFAVRVTDSGLATQAQKPRTYLVEDIMIQILQGS